MSVVSERSELATLMRMRAHYPIRENFTIASTFFNLRKKKSEIESGSHFQNPFEKVTMGSGEFQVYHSFLRYMMWWINLKKPMQCFRWIVVNLPNFPGPGKQNFWRFWCFRTHGYPIQKLTNFCGNRMGVCVSHSPFDVTKSSSCHISGTVHAIETFNPSIDRKFYGASYRLSFVW